MAAFGEDELIRRIDLALRAQPAPPERLLRHIIGELRRARGETASEYDDSLDSRESFYEASERGSSASSASCSYSGGGRSIASSCSRLAVSSTGSARAEHTSLQQLGGRADHAQDRYAAQYAHILKERREPKPLPTDKTARKPRELQIRELQAAMTSGKYPHADHVTAGLPTQIGGMQTKTPSLTANLGADSKHLLAEMGARQAKAKKPAKENGPGDFRF